MKKAKLATTGQRSCCLHPFGRSGGTSGQPPKAQTPLWGWEPCSPACCLPVTTQPSPEMAGGGTLNYRHLGTRLIFTHSWLCSQGPNTCHSATQSTVGGHAWVPCGQKLQDIHFNLPVLWWGPQVPEGLGAEGLASSTGQAGRGSSTLIWLHAASLHCWVSPLCAKSHTRLGHKMADLGEWTILREEQRDTRPAEGSILWTRRWLWMGTVVWTLDTKRLW